MPFTTHSLYKLERLRDTSSHRPRAQASSVQLSSHKGLGQCDWLCAVRLREAGVVGLISKGGVTKPKLNPHIFLNNPHRGDGSVCLASRKLRCCFGGGGVELPSNDHVLHPIACFHRFCRRCRCCVYSASGRWRRKQISPCHPSLSSATSL